MAFGELSGNFYWKLSADCTRVSFYLQLRDGSALHRATARLLFFRFHWAEPQHGPAEGQDGQEQLWWVLSSVLLLWNGPRGRTCQGHGKGQIKDASSTPPTLQYVLQITWTGLLLPLQSISIIKKLLRQPFNLPKLLLFAIQTHQKAISLSPSPFMGSCLQNTEC